MEYGLLIPHKILSNLSRQPPVRLPDLGGALGPTRSTVNNPDCFLWGRLARLCRMDPHKQMENTFTTKTQATNKKVQEKTFLDSNWWKCPGCYARRGWQTTIVGFVVPLTLQTFYFPILVTKCRSLLTPHWLLQKTLPVSIGHVQTPFVSATGARPDAPVGTTVGFTDDPLDPLNLLSGRPLDRPTLGSSHCRARFEPTSSRWDLGTSRVKPLFWERVWERFGTNYVIEIGFSKVAIGHKIPLGSRISSFFYEENVIANISTR